MNAEDLLRENQALRERLSRLSQAGLRINESLDLDTVLQEVVDNARVLTGSRYGAITVLGEAGQAPDFIVSGLTREEHRGLWEMPQGLGFFEYLSGLTTPLRVSNIAGHLGALGMGEFTPPVLASSLLVAPIRHRGFGVGTIYLAHETPGREFSLEDEETLVMFASQAALVIANARRYREEQRARNDLETLVNTSPVGVAVFDARTSSYVFVNREAQRIFAGMHQPDQTIAQFRETLDVRRPDGQEVPPAENPLIRAIGAGETVRSELMVFSIPGGRSVTAIVNATPISSDEGAIESVVVTLQDLAPLEEAERQRAEFLGTVSHELRAPLTSIKGSAAALLRTGSTLDAAEIQQFLRIIDNQADRILDLVGQLLDAARVEAGVLSVSPEPSDAAVLLDRAVGLFQGGGGRSNVSVDLPPDLPRVLADRRRIEQVLANLLSNAARHSPESSEIRVSAAMEGVHVAIAVADDGVGVSPERLPYLFRRFFRAEGDEQDGVGAGLGLAVCKGIVEAHGGRIRAESDGPGRGATFTFTLPAAEEAIILTEPASPGGRQPVRVLAVDDDAQVLRFVRDALTEAGYEVTATGDPQEALQLMEREQPRLVLLDLVLSGTGGMETDGIELMQDLLRIADVPVIFLSGYGRDRVIARAFEMGADDYIVKPFSPTELEARVQAALRRLTGPARMAPSEPYVRGDLTIDYIQRMVTVAGQPVRLTAIEYEFLRELSVHAGRVLTHQHLLQRVWGKTEPQTPRTIRTHLMRLRRKLGEDADNPRYIFAEPRVGYRMERPDAKAGGQGDA